MNFSIPRELIDDLECFRGFLKEHLSPHLPAWYGQGEIPKEFFQIMGEGGWKAENGEDFRVESSMAKYLAVNISREVTAWAADLYGAASVIFDHPIHKYPMDVWGSSLGEGTQDVHKLVIFRALMARYSG